jgi:hypothetical protein
MNRKIVNRMIAGLGATVVCGSVFAAAVTYVSYVASAGDQTRWSVRLVKKSGLSDYMIRRVLNKTHKDN